MRRRIKKTLTEKNKSQSLSNGNDPGVKNMKAILGFAVGRGGVFKNSSIKTCDANSSSLSSLLAEDGSHSVKALQPLGEKT